MVRFCWTFTGYHETVQHWRGGVWQAAYLAGKMKSCSWTQRDFQRKCHCERIEEKCEPRLDLRHTIIERTNKSFRLDCAQSFLARKLFHLVILISEQRHLNNAHREKKHVLREFRKNYTSFYESQPETIRSEDNQIGLKWKILIL